MTINHEPNNGRGYGFNEDGSALMQKTFGHTFLLIYEPEETRQDFGDDFYTIPQIVEHHGGDIYVNNNSQGDPCLLSPFLRTISISTNI